jgi:hypothetical protein
MPRRDMPVSRAGAGPGGARLKSSRATSSLSGSLGSNSNNSSNNGNPSHLSNNGSRSKPFSASSSSHGSTRAEHSMKTMSWLQKVVRLFSAGHSHISSSEKEMARGFLFLLVMHRVSLALVQLYFLLILMYILCSIVAFLWYVLYWF